MSNQSDTQNFVYANLLLNYTGQSPNGFTPASGSVVNTSPILSKPRNYFGMIARLSIDNYTVPLVIPRVVLNQPDINLLVYQFAIGYNGTYSDPINVEFITLSSARQPSSPVGNQQDLNSTYYYIYSYQQFLIMWNNALASALANLGTKITLPPTIQAPTFYYDYTSGLVFKAQTEFYEQDFSTTSAPTNKFQVYVDGNLTPYTNGLPIIYQSTLGTGYCKYSIMMVSDNLNIDPTGDYWLIRQESIAQLCYWPSITTIQLQSNMPIAPEYSQAPAGNQGYGQAPSQTISLLTDFVPDRSLNPAVNNLQIVYNKVDSLRLFDLISDSPLFRIDTIVSFVDNYGRIFPMYLSQGQSVSIKFEFIRKDVYSNMSLALR